MKKKKQKRFPDYEIVDLNERGIISFGTNVWIRNDKRALVIVFPCGQELYFKPEDEILTK